MTTSSEQGYSQATAVYGSDWLELIELHERFCRSISDIAFYKKIVATAGGVSVELGAGCGRATVVIGPTIAIEQVPGMAHIAAQRTLGSTSVTCESMLTYALETPATVSFAASRVFDHLADSDVERALTNIRTNTALQGLLAFDASQPDTEPLNVLQFSGAEDDVALWSVVTQHPEQSEALQVYWRAEFNNSGRLRETRIYSPLPLWPRSEQRWLDLLSASGWRPISCHGGFEGERLEAGSQQSVWVAQRLD